MERLNNVLSQEQLNQMLGSKGGRLAPKLPHCLTCYDLGNYEMALMSDGESIVKWIYTNGFEDNHLGKNQPTVKIYDKAKEYSESREGVTEVSIYRVQCEPCHRKFVAKHNEQAAIVKNKDFDETTRSLARAELQKIWGLTITGKR